MGIDAQTIQDNIWGEMRVLFRQKLKFLRDEKTFKHVENYLMNIQSLTLLNRKKTNSQTSMFLFFNVQTKLNQKKRFKGYPDIFLLFDDEDDEDDDDIKLARVCFIGEELTNWLPAVPPILLASS